MSDSPVSRSNSPARPASPPGGQEDDAQPGAFTPLTDSHGRELFTHELSYTPTLPEYPKTDVDGCTYVIFVPPEKRGSEKDALEIIEHVCTAPSLSFSSWLRK
jgi:hypothetical protein